VQKMRLKVDSGEILLAEKFEIKDTDNATGIEKKVSQISGPLVCQALEFLENEKTTPISQNEDEATYCRLIKKSDGEICWDYSGKKIINKVRAFVKWPVAFSFLNGKKVNFYRMRQNGNLNFSEFESEKNGTIVAADKNSGIAVKTADGLLNIELLQQEGKKILDWKNFLNGSRNLQGSIFGEIYGAF